MPPTVPAFGETGKPLCHRSSVHVRARSDNDLDDCVRIAMQVHESDGYPVYLPGDLGRFVASPVALSAWVEEDSVVLGHVALHYRSSGLCLRWQANHSASPRKGWV